MNTLYVITNLDEQYEWSSWDFDRTVKIINIWHTELSKSGPGWNAYGNSPLTPVHIADHLSLRLPVRAWIEHTDGQRKGYILDAYGGNGFISQYQDTEVQWASGGRGTTDLIYVVRDGDWSYGVDQAGRVFRIITGSEYNRWYQITPEHAKVEYEKDMAAHTKALYGDHLTAADWRTAQFRLKWALFHIDAVNWYFKLRRGYRDE